MIELTLFHTEYGNMERENEYTKVNWQIEEFCEKFFEEMRKYGMLSPDIKVLFKK